MRKLHQQVEILDYLETDIFNSGKCLAMDRPYFPSPPGEGEVRAKQSQEERLRVLDCQTPI